MTITEAVNQEARRRFGEYNPAFDLYMLRTGQDRVEWWAPGESRYETRELPDGTFQHRLLYSVAPEARRWQVELPVTRPILELLPVRELSSEVRWKFTQDLPQRIQYPSSAGSYALLQEGEQAARQVPLSSRYFKEDDTVGTDIHFYAEIRANPSAPWKLAGKVPLDRNYGLFGILAGVRAEGVTPIAPRRGLPANVSEGTKYLSDRGDGHSGSWLTYDELVSFDWQGTFAEHRLLLRPEQYAAFKETGSGQGLREAPANDREISNEEMDRLVAPPRPSRRKFNLSVDGTRNEPLTPESAVCTEVIWRQSYADIAGTFRDFLGMWLLLNVPTYSQGANLRFVFWFDS